MSPEAQKVSAYLESRIRKYGINSITYYNHLAAKFSMPAVTEAWPNHPLCSIFEELDLDDHSNDRPFRTAIVVNEKKKYPGNGFFTMIKKLRKPKKKKFSEIEMIEIYSDELEKLDKYYKDI